MFRVHNSALLPVRSCRPRLRRSPITGLAFSPPGVEPVLATSARDGAVQLWSLEQHGLLVGMMVDVESCGLSLACSEADGCAGCTTDGNGNVVTGMDCRWKVHGDGYAECFRTDDSTHCKHDGDDDGGPPELAKSNFVDSFLFNLILSN